MAAAPAALAAKLGAPAGSFDDLSILQPGIKCALVFTLPCSAFSLQQVSCSLAQWLRLHMQGPSS